MDDREAGCKSPIFICGDSRTGTTALWAALIQHPNLVPKIRVDKELPFFQEFFEGRRHPPYRRFPIDRIFEEQGVLFINSFMSENTGGRTGRYVTAKPNNMNYMNRILPYLPEARFILMLRHPQEVIWSKLHYPGAAKGGWRDPNSAPTDDFTDAELSKLADQWNASTRVILEALQGEHSRAMMLVRHEALIADPRSVISEVLNFVQEPLDDNVLDILSSRLTHSSFRGDEKGVDLPRYFADIRKSIAESSGFCSRVWPLVKDYGEMFGYADYASQSVHAGEDLGIAPPSKPEMSPGSSLTQPEAPPPAETGLVTIESCTLADKNGEACSTFRTGDSMMLTVTIRAEDTIQHLGVGFSVFAEDNTTLFGRTTFDERVELPTAKKGDVFRIAFVFDNICFQGLYRIAVKAFSITDPYYSDFVKHSEVGNAARFMSGTDRLVPGKFLVHNHVSIELLDGGRLVPLGSLTSRQRVEAELKWQIEALRQSFSFKVGNLLVRCIPTPIRRLLTGRNN
ncbi:MAG: sulfotransferase [Desulfomonile sp.]|nr:sulfotransferase [Desulfomonile sp.]